MISVVVLIVAFFARTCLFLFPALWVTLVYPSSLLGGSPVSGFVFFTLSISAAIVTVVVSFVSLVLAVVVVFVVLVTLLRAGACKMP